MTRIFSLAPVALMVLTLSCSPPPPPPTPSIPEGPEGSAAVEAYRTWVIAQTDELVSRTLEFTAAIEAGNRAEAQRLYAPSRMPFERIEPIAEALGDFDPRLDAREGDVPADQWRGFHRLEKILWSGEGLETGFPVAKALADDVRLLRAKVEIAEITAPSMVVGAVELLNEVSTSKITGEEERYSHTDLWDFRANVEGSAKIFEFLAPMVRSADPALATTLEQRFSTLLAALDAHRKGSGYQLYGELTAAEVKSLSSALDAVAEPLSQMGRLFPQDPRANQP